MDRIPFGIRQLDTTIGGGVPPGSVVLLSGEAGAGAREFIYTSALMNALSNGDPELFDLYYGDPAPGAETPPEVHYVSFASAEQQVRQEMYHALDDDVVDGGFESIRFHDLATEYFRLSPVPREWYATRTASISELGADDDRTSVPEALGARLTEHASENLVAIDSLTDLITASSEDVSWYDLTQLLKGLSRAAFDWDCVIMAHLNHETLPSERHGQLVDAADGTLLFEWESGGSTRARTMVVRQFRGVLARIEEENIVRFETEIGDAGFDISDVRKIR